MNDYFDRWIRIREIVERDNIICRKIEWSLISSDNNTLGRGSKHVVGSVGDIQLADRKLFLAMRVEFGTPYDEEHCLFQIQEFVLAFREGLKLPYFVGLVEKKHQDMLNYGILLEDVTNGGEFKIRPVDRGVPFFYREIGDQEEQLFLDPEDCGRIRKEITDLYWNSRLILK